MLILAEALLRNVSSVSEEDSSKIKPKKTQEKSFSGTLSVPNMHLNTNIKQQSRCVKCVGTQCVFHLGLTKSDGAFYVISSVHFRLLAARPGF